MYKVSFFNKCLFALGLNILGVNAIGASLDKYPTSINNPDKYVEIQLHGNQLIGNCIENNGRGEFKKIVETVYYGNVPQQEQFLTYLCSITIVDLKDKKYSVWWNPVFNEGGTFKKFIGKEGLGTTLVLSSAADVYGNGPSSLGLVAEFKGRCRKTPTSNNPNIAPVNKICNEADFRKSIQEFSLDTKSLYLEQNLDKGSASAYPCVGFSFPGACVKTEGGAYGGRCLEYGPPTHYSASSTVSCEEIP